MSPHVLWFNVVPAYVVTLIAIVSLFSNARFLRGFARARDWGGVAGASFACLIMGGWLFIALHTIVHPPIT